MKSWKPSEELVLGRERGQILLNACEAQSTMEGRELPIELDNVKVTGILVKSRHLGIVKTKT